MSTVSVALRPQDSSLTLNPKLTMPLWIRQNVVLVTLPPPPRPPPPWQVTDNSRPSGRGISGWSQTASQALASLQRTISGSSTARQPPGTGAGPKVRAWGSCVLRARRPAPSGQNVELSRLEFGLHGTRATGLSCNNPQAPALSQMYAHDAFHQTNPVGEAYLAPDPRQEKHSPFSPFLVYII